MVEISFLVGPEPHRNKKGFGTKKSTVGLVGWPDPQNPAHSARMGREKPNMFQVYLPNHLSAGGGGGQASRAKAAAFERADIYEQEGFETEVTGFPPFQKLLKLPLLEVPRREMEETLEPFLGGGHRVTSFDGKGSVEGTVWPQRPSALSFSDGFLANSDSLPSKVTFPEKLKVQNWGS